LYKVCVKNFWVVAALMLGLPLAAAAQPQDSSAQATFIVDGGVLYRVRGEARAAVTLPGSVRALHVAGDRAYVALGELGVAVVRVSSAGGGEEVVIEKQIPVSHGEVTGFMVEGESIWMQLSSTSAIRLHGEASAAPVTPVGTLPTTTPTDARPVEPQPAQHAGLTGIAITKVFDGQVLLNRGKSSGLRAGDRFKVIRREQLTDDGGSFEGEREVGVLVVDSLGTDSARALVWRGDRVLAGDHVEPADSNTDPSLMYPRQLHGFIEAELHLRPLLNMGEAGAGVLIDDHLTYYAEHHYLGLRNEPFGLGFGEDGTAFTQTTFAEGGYNSRPFAIGLALGFTSVYGDLQEMFDITSSDEGAGAAAPWDPSEPELGPWTQDMQHAFAIGQRVRLGALDGMNLLVSNTLLYFPGGGESADGSGESEAGFIWGGTNAKLTIPLAQRADLFIEGGGGVMGYAYGAVGVFTWLSGNGGPGSLGLMASAGGAGVWGARTQENYRYEYKNTEEIVVAGPMVSLGLRYRAALFGSD
jgi:hypothetical protein